MVRAQAMLLDALGTREGVVRASAARWAAAQVLQWAASYPRPRGLRIWPIACAARHSAYRTSRSTKWGGRAVMADPDWHGGNYAQHNTQPVQGPLAVARMAAHITYLSEAALQRKFGRTFRNVGGISFGFGPDFQHRKLSAPPWRAAHAELRRQLRCQLLSLHHPRDGLFRSSRPTTAMCWPMFRESSRGTDAFCLISFTSDWLFPTAQR